MKYLKTNPYFYFFAAALHWAVGVNIAMADPISDASQLSNTKAYTINTARGAWTLSSDNTILSSTKKLNDAKDAYIDYDDADQSSEAQEFAIYKSGDYYYLYSLEAGKFILTNGNESASLNDYVIVPYTVSTSDSEDYPLRISTFDSRYYANNNTAGSIVINDWSDQDDGNRLAIAEARDLTAAEQTAIATALSACPIPNHKAYTVTSNRGQWCANADGTALITKRDNPYPAVGYDQFSFMFFDDKCYLYNVGTKKFIKKDGSLKEGRGDEVYIRLSGDATRPYMFFFVDGGIEFNMQDNISQDNGIYFVMRDYNTPDDGNMQSVAVVGGVDPYTDALAEYNKYTVVTFNVSMDGRNIFTTTTLALLDAALAGVPDILTPTAAEPSYYSLALDDPEHIVEANDNIAVTCTWTGPFDLSENFEKAQWYNMSIGSQGRYVCYEPREPYIPHGFDATSAAAGGCGKAEREHYATEIVRASDAYQWAFLGDPYNGINVINKGRGASYQLTVEGTSPDAYNGTDASNTVLRNGGECNYNWEIHSNTQNSHADGFVLNLKGTNMYINPHGGSDGYFQIWNTGEARSNENSQLRVAEVPSPTITLNNGGDGCYYATLCMPYEVTVSTGTTAYTVASGESLGDGYAHLTPLEGGVIPAGTPVVLKGTSGTASLTYDCSEYVLSPLTTTKLTGTLMPSPIEASDYVLGKDAVVGVGFYHWDQTSLGANRAYLTAANGASVKGFAFDFEEEATSINEELRVKNEEFAPIYNLAGQRISKMQKGVNIINGKKILY